MRQWIQWYYGVGEVEKERTWNRRSAVMLSMGESSVSVVGRQTHKTMKEKRELCGALYLKEGGKGNVENCSDLT